MQKERKNRRDKIKRIHFSSKSCNFKTHCRKQLLSSKKINFNSNNIKKEKMGNRAFRFRLSVSPGIPSHANVVKNLLKLLLSLTRRPFRKHLDLDIIIFLSRFSFMNLMWNVQHSNQQWWIKVLKSDCQKIKSLDKDQIHEVFYSITSILHSVPIFGYLNKETNKYCKLQQLG